MHRLVLTFLVVLLGVDRLAAVEPPGRIVNMETGSAPIALALNPTTGQLFVLLPEGQLMVIDEVTRQTSAIVLPTNSFALAVDSSANHLYASSFAEGYTGDPLGGGLTVVDLTTGLTDFAVDSDLGVPVVNSSTHRVYVTRPSYVSHTGLGWHDVAVYEGVTLAKHGIRISGSRTVALAVDESDNRIYVAALGDATEQSDALTIVDGATEQPVDVEAGCPTGFPGASGTNNVAVDSKAHRVWVTCLADPRMLMVNADSLEVSAYPLEGVPTLFAVNPASHKLYVALDGLSTLTEIDPASSTVREISMPPVSGLAVNPRTNTIYAAHSNGVLTSSTATRMPSKNASSGSAPL